MTIWKSLQGMGGGWQTEGGKASAAWQAEVRHEAELPTREAPKA